MKQLLSRALSSLPRTAAPLAGAALALFLGASSAGAQVFQSNPGAIPGGNNNNSATENVDFGDVDLDGDWDAVFADGGDNGNDQNRIWINAGGLQNGTVGTFGDETTTRFPNIQDDSRDIEFADIDNDGDLDLYISNTAQLQAQSNRWWINEGLQQNGTLGFYRDETRKRWRGVGGPGSSVPASAVLLSGGFIDWSCDCDFGDLDNDGDLDLVHSSYGGAFGGNVPTRIFRNSGIGVFIEFNPSGFQLANVSIANGDPGLWCEGTQQSNTGDTTGANCDIASSALDIDVGDIDGDFDLDILHGARQELPRMFQNRLEENGGTLGFRDVTGNPAGSGVFPPGYSTGNGHYEQEMGDLDNDGDLDIYGLNWLVQFGLDDITLTNDGTGNFSAMTTLGNSSSDDNEGDFLDYDNDGDLDLYVANFSGTDRLYRNDLSGGVFSYTELSTSAAGLGSTGVIALDADAADVDKDGDTDVMVAVDAGGANIFLENILDVPDTHAPYIPLVENPGNRTATVASVPVRAHVYDNAPYYITWYAETHMEIRVDGCRLPDVKMLSSAGQIFRGVMPGNLDGNVTFVVRSTDEHGNAGVSTTQAYTSSTALTHATSFGSGNPGSLGEPSLDSLSVPFAGTTLHIAGGNAPPSTFYLLTLTSAPLGSPQVIPGVLTLNVGGTSVLNKFGLTDADGCARLSVPLASNLPAGGKVYAQFFTLDGTGGFQYGSSKGLEITSQ